MWLIHFCPAPLVQPIRADTKRHGREEGIGGDEVGPGEPPAAEAGQA